MIRVTTDRLVEVQKYLHQHAQFNMFTLANLADHGLDGDHPRSPQLWINDGPLYDVLSVTSEGMVMPFLPSGQVAGAAEVLHNLGGLVGMIGPAGHVRALQDAAGLSGAPSTMDEDEPQFILQLDQLQMPDVQGALIDFADAPELLMRDWMTDYQRNTLHTPADQVADFVERDYAARVAKGSHKVLVINGECVAKTGFNAHVSVIVQIGGVYTPPDLRGRGFARGALALHLQQAQAQGVAHATLFSASDMAARAYRAIGFEQIGEWALTLFDGPQVAHG